MAVANIVKANNYPLPFILFGPPGTGKTRTLVAAIQEIICSSNGCVLVCSGSNSACNELVERLINVLSVDEVHRLYAQSYKMEKISEKIRPNANIKDGKIKIPSLDYLYKFRVIVCTLQMAGFLSNARQSYPNFRSNHFSHVIIDEAACCQESLALIPIAGQYLCLHIHKEKMILL